MKFLHTADWQMGMGAPAEAAAKGEAIRGARLEAARKVVSLAADQDVDFLVLAGDTFEHNGVDRVLVRQVGEILASADRPVYLLPGNHDPLVPGSVWEHSVWDEFKSLHVLVEQQPLEVPGGLLWPTPVRQPHSQRDQTAWMETTGEERICLGVAHGNVQGGAVGSELPIPRDAPQRTGLDYLALGHWHSLALYREGEGGPCRMAYSGTHEPTAFGERDSGHALVVEIAQRGAAPVIQEFDTSVLIWKEMKRTLSGPQDIEALIDELNRLDAPDKTMLRLRLSGLFTPEALDLLGRLEEILAARFLLGRLDTEGLTKLPEDDSWLDGLGDALTRTLGERLAEMAGSGDPELAETARLALAELFDLAKAVRP